MARSYNGWTASSIPRLIGIVHFEPIPGFDFPGGIKNGDVKVVFTYLVQQLHRRVEPISIYPPGDEWGYAYRDNVNNPGQLSCHASGTAIDYNATEHPNRVEYTWTREQARTINKIVNEELGGVVKWLEGWDEMHFEIRGTSSQVKTVADKIRNGTISGAPPPSPPPPPPPPTGDLVYRIYWYKTSTGTTAAYRCLVAKAEGSNIYWEVEGWHIADTTELGVWRSRGLKEGNTPSSAIAPRGSIALHGGPYDNTKIY